MECLSMCGVFCCCCLSVFMKTASHGAALILHNLILNLVWQPSLDAKIKLRSAQTNWRKNHTITFVTEFEITTQKLMKEKMQKKCERKKNN